MKDKNDNEMSFLDHLEELRWHIIRAVASILVGAIGVFLCKDFIWNSIILAPTKKTFFTYRAFCSISNSLCFGPKDNIRMYTRDFGEQFMMHMVSSFWIGLIIAFPYILWEVWRFVKPGLYSKEQNVIKGVVAICSLLFFLGVLFGYYVVTPFGISFLTNYTISESIDTSVSLASYVENLTMFVLPMGMVFELPVIVYFLAKVGILNGPMLKTFRKHAIVAIVIVAAIITPPDVASQVLVSLPLIGLYEVSIFIASRVNPLKKEDDEPEEDDEEESKDVVEYDHE
ncbi:MAG: twin-arginine translocase subunit TatC [Saprospiraceae bacterium]